MGRPNDVQRLRRVEDHRLITGTGCYVGDLAVAGTLDAVFVRSPLAHARIAGVDATAARAAAGVVAVVVGAELGDVAPAPTMFPPASKGRSWWGLAREVVRFVGDPVAIVVAGDRYLAEDAAELVVLDLDPLPPLLSAADSLTGPRLFSDVSNVALDNEFGAPVRASTWERAAAVVEGRYRQQLLAPTPLEPRAILVDPNGDHLDVHCSHQHPHGLRQGLAVATGLPPEHIRVRVPDAGGAFGSKSPTFPEYVAVALLALRLQQPVRWLEDRNEALTAATRGRGQDQTVRLAADADGTLLAVDLHVDADIGAYPVGAAIPMQTGLQATGPYRVREVHARVRSVLTTTTPTFAYRGAGRPEAAYALERGMDQLARALHLDPVDLRRRNLLRPDELPYDTPTGRTYDSGDYRAALEIAVRELDVPRWRAEQRRRGADPAAWPLGIGIATYIERTGGEPGILEEYGSVRLGPDGVYRARTGTSSTGQSHETVFATVVANVLGVDAAVVQASDGDTGESAGGNGSFASRSLQMGGAALHEAAGAFVDVARAAAAERFDVPVDAVRWRAGELWVDGQPPLPAVDLVVDGGELFAEHWFSSPAAFSYGTYGAVVEVDPDVGTVRVLQLVAVDDYGTVVDHTVVHGQTLGSSVQGLGQVLYEGVELDAAGRPRVDLGLLDYLLPTISELPPIVTAETAVPNPNNPLGAKGAGEAGCIGVPPAVVNAVIDAIRPADPGLLQMPLTPQTVWRAMTAPMSPTATGGDA